MSVMYGFVLRLPSIRNRDMSVVYQMSALTITPSAESVCRFRILAISYEPSDKHTAIRILHVELGFA